MKTYLSELIERNGNYHGEGINHEGQAFRGTISLGPILEKRGLAIEFKAVGKDGTVYHHENSFLAPTLDDSLALWVISNNHPAVVQHDFRREIPLATANGKTLVFGINRPEDKNTFREEIAVDLYADGAIGYRYFWGMPGGEFKERSGAKMTR